MNPSVEQRLRHAAQELALDRVPLQHLADAHGSAALGSLLILLSVACATPISGAGMVLGGGIVALCIALWRGHDTVSLPARIGALCLPKRWAHRVLIGLSHLYAFFARWSRPRWHWVGQDWTRRWLAAKGVVMAVIVILPIPLGNLAPALALVLLGLGLVFRDGIVMLASALASWFALFVTGLIAATGWHLMVDILPASLRG
ncbi:MAG: exopolysaccharide biosynthesis protein [Aquabacterium sp.]